MKYLIIKNFRNFKDVFIPISNKTIFTGENGLGKSTILEIFNFFRNVNEFKFNSWDHNGLFSNIDTPEFFTLFDYQERKNEEKNWNFEYFKFHQTKNGDIIQIKEYATLHNDDLVTFKFEKGKPEFYVSKKFKKTFTLETNETLSKSAVNSVFKEIKKVILQEHIPLPFFNIFNGKNFSFAKLFSAYENCYEIFNKNKSFLDYMNNYNLLDENMKFDLYNEIVQSFISKNDEYQKNKEVLLNLLLRYMIGMFDFDLERDYIKRTEEIIDYPGIREFNKIIDPKSVKNNFEKMFVSSKKDEIANTINNFLEKSKKNEWKFEIEELKSVTNDIYFSLNARYFDEKVKMEKIVNIKDVGQGYGQIIPLLLNPNTKKLQIFRQPEIHLHPSLSASFGSYLYSLDKFILETHSKELLDRIRYEHSLVQKDIIFIHTLYKNDKKITCVETVKVDDNGRIPNADRYFEFFDDERLKWLK